MDYYRFEILTTENQEAKEKSFSLSPGSFLLRIFSNPIEVTYDVKTKRLLKYRGLSNIQSDAGNSQEVLITYEAGSK